MTHVPDGGELVFPIGHYVGAVHPDRGAPALHVVVRVGWDTPKLQDEAHHQVWWLAHRSSGRGGRPWTRQAIVDHAGDTGTADAGEVFDTLVSLGLLAVIPPSIEQEMAFARRYRVQALLVGLGNTPSQPAMSGIGLPGLPPLLDVPTRYFEVWQWAHLWPNIWASCEGLAEVARETGDTEPSATRPEQVLESTLQAIRTLIARNAIYLDTSVD